MYYNPPKIIFVPKKSGVAKRIPEDATELPIPLLKGETFVFNTVLEEFYWNLKNLKEQLKSLIRQRKKVEEDVIEPEKKLQGFYFMSVYRNDYLESKGLRKAEEKVSNLYKKRNKIVKKIQKMKMEFEAKTKNFISLAGSYAEKDLERCLDKEPLTDLFVRKGEDNIKSHFIEQFIMDNDKRYFLYKKDNGNFGIKGIT